jgi:hypothetical protein
VFQYIRGYEVWSIGKPEVYDRKTGSRASILGSLLSVSGRFKTQEEAEGENSLEKEN